MIKHQELSRQGNGLASQVSLVSADTNCSNAGLYCQAGAGVADATRRRVGLLEGSGDDSEQDLTGHRPSYTVTRFLISS